MVNRTRGLERFVPSMVVDRPRGGNAQAGPARVQAMRKEGSKHEPGEQDQLRRTRRAPQPPQPDEKAAPPGETPAAMWGNPAATPAPGVDKTTKEKLARERRGDEAR